MADVIYGHNENHFEFGFEGQKAPRIPAGTYRAAIGMRGDMHMYRNEMITDSLIKLDSKNITDVTNHIDKFLSASTRKKFDAYGFLYRTGVLMYGIPGSGKTSAVIQIVRNFIEKHDGIVFNNIRLDQVNAFVAKVRQDDPGRCVMILLEELDSKLEYDEETVLNLLDGQNSINNFIVMATTNYIDKIPNRIKNRPSRFALLKEVGTPSAETRRAYLEKKIHEDDMKTINLDEVVEKTDGFTIDHLKDLIVTMFCFEFSVDDAVTKTKEMIAMADEEEDDDD